MPSDSFYERMQEIICDAIEAELEHGLRHMEVERQLDEIRLSTASLDAVPRDNMSDFGVINTRTGEFISRMK